jgi:hypothetical protein
MQIRIRNPGTKLNLSATNLKFMTGLLPTAGPKLSTVFSLNSILLRVRSRNVHFWREYCASYLYIFPISY